MLQVFYPLQVFFEDLVAFFWPVLCRTFHNLISNKFVILKNKNLDRILQVGKIYSFKASLLNFFLIDKSSQPNVITLFLKTSNHFISRSSQTKETKSIPKTIISFNFYLQVLVLVMTEIQIQLYKYQNNSPMHAISFPFFQTFFLLIPACSSFWVCISSSKLNSISCGIC